MKKLLFLLIVFLTLGFSESSPKTAADRYLESYAAAMRRQTAMTAAEVRAGDYRARYQVCDQHHDCGSSLVSPLTHAPIV